MIYWPGESQDLFDALATGRPLILAALTNQLPYWTETTQHALVLAGLDGDVATVHDPAFADPVQVNIGDVLLAWDEMGNSLALIEPT